MLTISAANPPATMADVMEQCLTQVKPKPRLMMSKDGAHWQCYHRATTWTGFGLTKVRAYQNWERLNGLPPEAVYRG